jgi:hypothetical protein
MLHLDIKGMTRFSEVSLRGDGRLRGKQKHPGFQAALHVAIEPALSEAEGTTPGWPLPRCCPIRRPRPPLAF